MNLKTSEQLAVGLWAAAATFIGITSRSAAAALPVLALGALFCAPTYIANSYMGGTEQ